MTPADRFVTVNGLRLHYLEFGSPDLPVIVCVHGLTNNAHDFDRVAPHLAANYRVIALDVRGRGDSEWGPAEQYNIPTYAGDVAAILAALSIERVSLIGNSMGGRVSLLYAAGHPGRVERIVLNDIGPSLDPAMTVRINSYVAQAPAEFAQYNEVVRYYERDASMAGLAGHAGEAMRECARWTVKEQPNGRLTWKIDPALRRSTAGQTAIRPLDLWSQFEALTTPVLIVRGGASDVLSEAMAQRMREAGQNVRLAEIAGVGHVPSLIEPEALAALREFFSL